MSQLVKRRTHHSAPCTARPANTSPGPSSSGGGLQPIVNIPSFRSVPSSDIAGGTSPGSMISSTAAVRTAFHRANAPRTSCRHSGSPRNPGMLSCRWNRRGKSSGAHRVASAAAAILDGESEAKSKRYALVSAPPSTAARPQAIASRAAVVSRRTVMDRSRPDQQRRGRYPGAGPTRRRDGRTGNAAPLRNETAAGGGAGQERRSRTGASVEADGEVRVPDHPREQYCG